MKAKSIFTVGILLLVLVFFNYCKKDENQPVKHKFPGLIFKDEIGQDIGFYGGTDDHDWEYDKDWPQEVYDLMNFNDTVSLSGTYLDSSYIAGNNPQWIQFVLFPNPVAHIARIIIDLPGRIKFKLVFVDNYLNPILKYSFKKLDRTELVFDLNSENKFVEGEVYRLYYTMSVEGKENFYKGHGDILMCDEFPPTYPSTCLRYLDE